MPNINDVTTKVLNLAKEFGINARTENYHGETIIILELSEDFSIYVSVICDNECDVEYAIGDENFTFRPNHVGQLKKALEIIERLNNELTKNHE